MDLTRRLIYDYEYANTTQRAQNKFKMFRIRGQFELLSKLDTSLSQLIKPIWNMEDINNTMVIYLIRWRCAIE